MSTAPGTGTADDPGADDGGAAALMRSAAVRDLDAEGIPVVLALVGGSAPGAGRPAAADPAAVDGARLTGRARELRDRLWPDARPGDLFTTYAVLATLGRADVEGR